ncbi:uncharacterized protein METZ01_LOCUS426781, partial [marine metagenome]
MFNVFGNAADEVVLEEFLGDFDRTRKGKPIGGAVGLEHMSLKSEQRCGPELFRADPFLKRVS